MLEILRRLVAEGDRLSTLDASFIYLENAEQPLHVGVLAILDGAPSFAHFATALAARLARLPRHRQRTVRPLLDLGPPAWEDDPDYDPRRHIHHLRWRPRRAASRSGRSAIACARSVWRVPST